MILPKKKILKFEYSRKRSYVCFKKSVLKDFDTMGSRPTALCDTNASECQCLRLKLRITLVWIIMGL